MYGGLGGLGGFSYPARMNAPTSNRVMSDTEFRQDWQSRMPSQFLGSLTRSRHGDTPLPTPVMILQQDGTLTRPRHGNLTSLPTPSTDYATQGMASTAETPSAPTINPAWQEMQQRMQQAIAMRGENQTRQQQAYDGMTGWGAANGLLPEGYSSANFGQISGQNGNAQPGQGGGTDLGGTNTQWATGAYSPNQGQSGLYNPNPYSYQSMAKGWGL